MSIELHCESCKKKIKAPDNAGGKWGNCPHCKHKCYIPLPKNEDEEFELKLAPIDESDETQYGQLMKETHDLTQNILQERELADDPGDKHAENVVSEKELIKQIIIYLRMMADGELDHAEQIAVRLMKSKGQAVEILKKMARAERPEPELQNIPGKILLGLMKGLHKKLK